MTPQEILKLIVKCAEMASCSIEVKHDYPNDRTSQDFSWMKILDANEFIQTLNKEIEKYDQNGESST